MPRRRLARSLLVAATLLLGCGAGWHRVALLPDQSIPPRQQAQVWRQATALRLHGLILSADTLRGLPYMTPLGCDSCERVILPLATVDSIRYGNPVGGFWRSVGFTLGGLVGGLVLGCALFGGCNWGP